MNDDEDSLTIRWSLGEPIRPVEHCDLLHLATPEEISEYVQLLQDELSWLRPLLHEALAAVERLTVERDRDRLRRERLIDELRMYRQPRR